MCNNTLNNLEQHIEQCVIKNWATCYKKLFNKLEYIHQSLQMLYQIRRYGIIYHINPLSPHDALKHPWKQT